MAVKSGNSLAIDDITIGHGHSLDKVALAGYEGLATGDVACIKVTGLEPETEYYYTVRGVDGDRMSLLSDEVRVKTNGTGGIVGAEADASALIRCSRPLYRDSRRQHHPQDGNQVSNK